MPQIVPAESMETMAFGPEPIHGWAEYLAVEAPVPHREAVDGGEDERVFVVSTQPRYRASQVRHEELLDRRGDGDLAVARSRLGRSQDEAAGLIRAIDLLEGSTDADRSVDHVYILAA